jgi:hypothetical protein
MKKLLIGLLLLTACSQSKKLDTVEKDGKLYKFSTLQKDGSGQADTLTLTVSNAVVDSLKLSDKDIADMISRSCSNAISNMKYPLTYKYRDFGHMILNSHDTIKVYILGQAKNGFGVDMENTSVARFAGKKLVDSSSF